MFQLQWSQLIILFWKTVPQGSLQFVGAFTIAGLPLLNYNLIGLMVTLLIKVTSIH